MKLPVPQRGQPFDISFVYKMTESINALWDRLAINVSAYASLWTREGVKQRRASEVKIITGNASLNLGASVKADDYKEFVYDFDIAFALPPIVTASPIVDGTTTVANKNVYAVIGSVTTSQVKGFVKFEKAGDLAGMSVNIIAIGVPV
jgi:hypothetical protein